MPDLILNQTEIPADRWRYGLRSSAKTGCGWIAVYNCLALLGRPKEPEEIIRGLELQMPGLHGTFGTLCLGPAILLKKWGFRVETQSDVQKFDSLLPVGATAILFYYWRKGLRLGAHFVTVQREERGFVGYNTYSNSSGPDFYGESLEAFLKKNGFFGCVLTKVFAFPCSNPGEAMI